MKLLDRLRARLCPCNHPESCRDRIFNGAWTVDMCGLCGECFDMQKPTKGITVALDIKTLETELNSVVSEADSVADIADKYADILVKYADLIPGAGSEIQTVVGLLDKATKALDELKSALARV